MPALDYTVAHQGLTLRLLGIIRSGWTARAGKPPYFRGICLLSWKGAKTRVDLSLTCPSGTGLAAVEAMSWRADDLGTATTCELTRGQLTLQVPLLCRDEAESIILNPGFVSEGISKLCFRRSVQPATALAMRWNASIIMDFDSARPDPVSWERGSGMASAGLPSLGKRR